MAKASVRNCQHYVTLAVCLNMVVLMAVCRQQLTGSDPTSAELTTQSCPTIRTTDETLYVMYGEGDLGEYDDQLLDYIRSMTAKPAPGGVHLSSDRLLPGQLNRQRPSRADFSQVGGSKVVDKLLQHRRHGFYVECGAFRGEEFSDTLFFELKRNWTGLLIEPHPAYHREILQKNRRALVLRACLSSAPTPGLKKFKLAGWGSGVSSLNKNEEARSDDVPETDVQCFSLNSIAAAFDVTHVDFMVLDVEGAELPVLETIDWTRLTIDVLSIEYSDNGRRNKLNKIRQFFNKTGVYKEVLKLPLGANQDIAQDVIFMRV